MSTKQYLLNIESLLKMSSSRYGYGFGASRRYLELQHPYLPNVPLSQLPQPVAPPVQSGQQQQQLSKPEMNRQSGDHKSNDKQSEKKKKEINVMETLSKVINDTMKSNKKRRAE
jgi:ABC-type uncharacterized transport system involved in gliding motility auxiliary subunit